MPLQSRKSRQDTSWQVLTVPVLAAGLNTRGSPELIDDQETPYAENVSFRESRVRSDFGFTPFANTIASDKAQGGYQHRTAAGNTETILVTQNTFFRYNATNLVWEYVPAGVNGDGNFVLDVGELALATVMRVIDTTGFTAGNRIAVALDSGLQHRTTIASIIVNTSITLNVAIPTDAGINNPIFEAAEFSGDDDHQVVFIPVPEQQWTAFTNGVDVPQRWNGSTIEAIPGLPFSGNIVCRTMVMLKNSLILGNIIENGTIKPYLVMWSDVGDVTEWNIGDAGNNPLVDARDDIIALKPLGRDVIIYRKKSIVRMEFVGAAFELWRFRTLVFGEILGAQGVGAVSPNSVFAVADQHIIFGQEGIYLYKGGTNIELISQKIFSGTFDSDGDVDPNSIHRSFVQFFDRTNEVYFMYADTKNTFPNRALVLDIESFRWRKRKFPFYSFTSSNLRVVPNEPGVLIQDLVGTIAQQTWIIGGAAISGGIPNVMLCAATVSITQVYEFDYISIEQDTAPIPWFIETKDFRAGDRLWRFDWIEVKASGPAITVSISFDGGASFVELGTTESTGMLTTTRFYGQYVTEILRFRLAASSSGAELGTIQFKIREESRWDL